MTQLFFLFAIVIGSVGHTQEKPDKAIFAAKKYLHSYLQEKSPSIDQTFDEDWEYLIQDSDDQPLVVKFTGSTLYCEVTIGSQSLQILNLNCQPDQGIAFYHSFGCGVYDGAIAILRAPQSRGSCERIAKQRGLLEQFVSSYCLNTTIGEYGFRESSSLPFVEACVYAFSHPPTKK